MAGQGTCLACGSPHTCSSPVTWMPCSVPLYSAVSPVLGHLTGQEPLLEMGPSPLWCRQYGPASQETCILGAAPDPLWGSHCVSSTRRGVGIHCALVPGPRLLGCNAKAGGRVAGHCEEEGRFMTGDSLVLVSLLISWQRAGPAHTCVSTRHTQGLFLYRYLPLPPHFIPVKSCHSILFSNYCLV